METAAGVVLIPLGVLILAFGGVPRRASDPATAAARVRRLATDLVFRWATGLSCLAFGLGLVFKTVSFG